MRTIYFFTSPLCGACQEWKESINAFIAAHGHECFVLHLNPNLKAYQYGDWKVQFTPSAMVQENGQVLRVVEGKLLTADELAQFVLGETWEEPRNKRSRARPVDYEEADFVENDDDTDDDDPDGASEDEEDE